MRIYHNCCTAKIEVVELEATSEIHGWGPYISDFTNHTKWMFFVEKLNKEHRNMTVGEERPACEISSSSISVLESFHLPGTHSK